MWEDWEMRRKFWVALAVAVMMVVSSIQAVGAQTTESLAARIGAGTASTAPGTTMAVPGNPAPYAPARLGQG